jgi:hypothetical protein
LDWQCMWHVWGEKKCIQDFDRETWRKNTTVEDRGIDGGVIL